MKSCGGDLLLRAYYLGKPLVAVLAFGFASGCCGEG